jgi:hypothetical protein
MRQACPQGWHNGLVLSTLRTVSPTNLLHLLGSTSGFWVASGRVPYMLHAPHLATSLCFDSSLIYSFPCPKGRFNQVSKLGKPRLLFAHSNLQHRQHQHPPIQDPAPLQPRSRPLPAAPHQPHLSSPNHPRSLLHSATRAIRSSPVEAGPPNRLRLEQSYFLFGLNRTF